MLNNIKVVTYPQKVTEKDVFSTPYRQVSLKILNGFPKVLDNVSLELGKQKEFRISIASKVEDCLRSPKKRSSILPNRHNLLPARIRE